MFAPLKVVDAIEAAATLPFLDGVRREREIFFECLRSDQCKALVHAFFAERAVARVPDVPKETPTTPIATVAIIGAGTMGSGIATACANAGLQVVLADVDRAAVDRGMAGIRRNYESSVKRGRYTPEDAERRIGLIREATGYDGVAAADLVIEAVFENLALKKQVFAAIDAAAKPGCILASNTSTLSIDEIAGETSRPEAVIGMHFFSPAHIMRLVEIVRGAATGTSVLATALAFAKKLNKVGVAVRNGPGFVGNRMMFPYMYEAQFLVEDGATPEQVDRVLTDWGMAMGIFAVDDMGGLDVAWRVRQELHQFEEPGARKPIVADVLVAMGRLGQKTGMGWYRYAEDRKPIPDPEIVALIEREATKAGIVRRAVSDEEIRERAIYALINEGARVLEDGIASRAADIDVIYLTGYGFPALSRRPDVLRGSDRPREDSVQGRGVSPRAGPAVGAGAAARAAGEGRIDVPRVRRRTWLTAFGPSTSRRPTSPAAAAATSSTCSRAGRSARIRRGSPSAWSTGRIGPPIASFSRSATPPAPGAA